MVKMTGDVQLLRLAGTNVARYYFEIFIPNQLCNPQRLNVN
jgi:hypothetical protein